MNPQHPSALGRLRHSKACKLAVKAGLTLAAFWFVFRGVDFAHLALILEKQDHAMLLVALVLVVVQMMLGAFRWHLILAALAGQRVMPVTETLRLYYISVFFNCCLPGTVGGDVIRVWLARSDRVPLPLSIHSVIIDRIIALLALGVLVMLTLPVLGAVAGFDAALILPLMLIAAAAGIWVLFNIDRLLVKFDHIRPVRWIRYFLGSLRLLLAHHAASAASFAYALVAHLAFCVCGYVMARSLGIDISFTQCVALIPLVMLVTTLPISIGGWGVREAGMVGMLGMIGVAQAPALMLSIQLGLINIFVSLPAGLLWLVYRRHGARPPDGAVSFTSAA